MQGWFEMVVSGYGLRNFVTIIEGEGYVSSDTTEDDGFLLVTF